MNTNIKQVPQTIKTEVFQFLQSKTSVIENIDLRTFIKGVRFRQFCPADWQEKILRYACESQGLERLAWRDQFKDMETLADLVIDGVMNALFIYGTPGTGKTYRIMERLKAKGKVRDKDFIFMKGNASAGGLYATIHNNREKLIVFDDCDDSFQAERTGNILKAALDTCGERIVSWPVKNASGGLEPSFEFSGTVIFISNLSRDDVEKAILSRSLCMEIGLNPSEMLEMIDETLVAA